MHYYLYYNGCNAADGGGINRCTTLRKIYKINFGIKSDELETILMSFKIWSTIVAEDLFDEFLFPLSLLTLSGGW